MSESIDDLFEPAAQAPWLDRISDDCRKWVTDLAEAIIARGREPSSWNEVHRHVREKFPDDAPKQSQTVKDNVRKIVEERI